ncbi:MAG: hypothetical protein F4Y82_05800 [Cenarchaeum sp. SB0665_bin_23]|nr:hypothetical protein [Cenarchaeum sp. SB0667_bin_13]MXY37413.1 hypothetical protein [Cenarchaeum sp. SB0664_bin_35]MXY61604.1 hypothetical protein [Cenarchaeum sp. SB0665_bin_23]MXZ93356.1 hypothetical protein [Cenarchaeum sp. SB0666_bin_15]MYB46500.1 hypothetical protein [Cenarchaeum sp. SB0662_bin_33]MYC80407.1 hypothetical protein [Cenarchaeum sp. SB0661_bin_35]MYD59046.1 hypothetical protein [Cenarchaeum sp. SB0678_bin_8]MYG33717.1 hypothetical protein [Cenarchaeum sp. SB0677_bin_16]
MSITSRVTILLNLNEGMADMLYRSLKPDNVNIPPDMSISMNVTNDTLSITVSSPDNPSRVIHTVDEILAHAQMILDVTRT